MLTYDMVFVPEPPLTPDLHAYVDERLLDHWRLLISYVPALG